MDNQRLFDALERTNPWWKGDFELDYKPRRVYEEIKKFIKNRQIISLTGLRRTGKTTILLKAVKDSMADYGKENIIYFSFDDFKDAKLKDVIEAYFELMKKNSREPLLFLFDEIQKVSGWEEQLKRIYDENKNFKFVISGSESLFIRKGTRESLAGRIFEFQVKTLSFKEFLEFRGKKFDNLALYKKEILSEFKNFLYCNGFPEIINENEEFIKKYIKENVVEKIIYRDIPQIVPIENPEILSQMLNIIAKEPGQIIQMDKIAKELNISRQTASNYLDYLEKSFLIRKLYNFSRNARKTQTRLKKYYPVILFPEEIENREIFGSVFETFAVNELNAEFFWRDTYKNEVDIILKNKEIIPIEIKVSNIETKPLNLFISKFKLKGGIILTYDKEET
ncbi:MAG TPA: ATP-binding protein, partial [Candidatus Nanoarchaeia archaeon]|nr:ATP-binding protein [Candidatus Nanoarchaeia archaeon]